MNGELGRKEAVERKKEYNRREMKLHREERQTMGGVRCTGYGWLTGCDCADSANKRQDRRAMAELAEATQGQNEDGKASPTRQVAESRRGAKVVKGSEWW